MLDRRELKGLPPIPMGKQRFVITGCQKGVSSTGNPAISTTLTIPEDTDLDPEWVGRDIKTSLSLQKQAAFTLGNFLAALNGYETVDEWMDTESLEGFDVNAWDPSEAIGASVIGAVSHQDYQGRMTAQVRTFEPVVDVD